VNNTRQDFELILVDDCSTDETPEILRSFLRDHPGNRLIRHESNRGLADARNTGLEAAQGRYLTFLDGDDWLAPGYLPELVDSIEQLGCDFLRTDHVQVTGRSRVIRRAPQGRRNEVLDPRQSILPADQSSMVDYAFAWAGIYHRRLLDDGGVLRFPEGLRTAEDRPWIWRLHRLADSYAVVSKPGVFYRRGVSTSLTQIGDVRQLDFIRSFDTVLAELADDPEADALMIKAVRNYCAIIAHHISNQGRFEPAVLAQLRTMATDALRRMPQDVLDTVLVTMDAPRGRALRRLRGTAKAVAR
jgi:glycosyltransferase involved in cell wall biosynthesis